MCASKAKKILTIDDDEDIRSTISLRLEMEGFETVWAKNGRVALEYMNNIVDSELPDLILLDFMMPVMNGQEFCKEKAKNSRLAPIPVVMMTAGGNLISLMDKVDQGANGYMSKPMDEDTIINTVKYFLYSLPETSSKLATSVSTDPKMVNESMGLNIIPVLEGIKPQAFLF